MKQLLQLVQLFPQSFINTRAWKLICLEEARPCCSFWVWGLHLAQRSCDVTFLSFYPNLCPAPWGLEGWPYLWWHLLSSSWENPFQCVPWEFRIESLWITLTKLVMAKVDVPAVSLFRTLVPSHQLSTLFSQCGFRLLCVGLELMILVFFSHTLNSSELNWSPVTASLWANQFGFNGSFSPERSKALTWSCSACAWGHYEALWTCLFRFAKWEYVDKLCCGTE